MVTAKRIYFSIIAILFLFIGGLIYLCYRSPAILLFRLLDMINFNYSVFQNINVKMPSFFIYNFSNALFVLFGCIIVYVIWDNNRKYFLLYTSIITFFSIVYETITKDISDIITILASYSICLLIYLKIYGVKYEK
jgi:hypothetical protein